MSTRHPEYSNADLSCTGARGTAGDGDTTRQGQPNRLRNVSTAVSIKFATTAVTVLQRDSAHTATPADAKVPGTLSRTLEMQRYSLLCGTADAVPRSTEKRRPDVPMSPRDLRTAAWMPITFSTPSAHHQGSRRWRSDTAAEPQRDTG